MSEQKRKVRKGSKWLGPNTRKEVFGSEDAGVPRPSRGFPPEGKGWFRAARVRRAAR